MNSRDILDQSEVMQFNWLNKSPNIYLFKVNSRETKMWNMLDVTDVVLVFLLLTLNIYHTFV